MGGLGIPWVRLGVHLLVVQVPGIHICIPFAPELFVENVLFFVLCLRSLAKEIRV